MDALEVIGNEIPVVGLNRRSMEFISMDQLMVGIQRIAFHAVCPVGCRHTVESGNQDCTFMDKKCHKTDEPLLLYPMTALNLINADRRVTL